MFRHDTPAEAQFRTEVRTWLEANLPKPLRGRTSRPPPVEIMPWYHALSRKGWIAPHWPKQYGGMGATLNEQIVMTEELARVGAPHLPVQGLNHIGPILMEFGTDAQKARFLPAMAAGEHVWAQGWSEPNAGSDMAAIRTTAIRIGDEYVLNGQKIWSTRAVWADWLFGLFRSDPESSRHHGLTFLMVPLSTPGITVRPIRQLNGQTGFAEIFFDDVRVPVENRLAAEGAGWQVAMATAGFERGLMLRSPARFQRTAQALRDLYLAHRDSADRDPTLRERVVSAWMDAQAYALSTYATASRLLKGGHIGAESSTNKVFWSELDLRMHQTALDILGAHGEVVPQTAAQHATLGHWLDGFLFAQAGPIYAGTNEIQRNIVAERMLGMPRA